MPARRIVLGYDESGGADAAVRWCQTYARVLDAEVIAVTVIDLVPFIGLPPMNSPLSGETISALEQGAGASLERGMAPLRGNQISYRALVRAGNPADELNRVAAEENADFLVVGRRGRGGFAEMVLGSVPHALAHHGRCPVVIVPAA
jgi:nucleotide-binding universal stress UspA family protein